MSDRLTIEQRHNNMAAIRGRDTKPEILVRMVGNDSDNIIAEKSIQVSIAPEPWNSWGAWPLEKYRLHYGDKNFTFVLIPLD